MPTSRNRSLIRQRLDEIEANHGVRMLYACESGSRAWGFPSRDSDYDVRFLYLRPLTWYLAVDSRPDTIEVMLEGALDLGGWDLRKGFQLLGKSNAALLEWLVSPIVYHRDPVVEPLERLADEAFLPETVCHHYLALARRKMGTMEDEELVSFKSYCYLLRAVLSAAFVAERLQRPPMDLPSLVAAGDVARPLREQIDELVERKRSATEADRTRRIAELDDWLWRTLEHTASRVPRNSGRLGSERLNQAFLESLRLGGVLPPR